MLEFWPVYSGERFRASWPSCFLMGQGVVRQVNLYANSFLFPLQLAEARHMGYFSGVVGVFVGINFCWVLFLLCLLALFCDKVLTDEILHPFCYIGNSGVLPNPGEIIFCDKDKDGNSSMTWSYSHPRVISLIQSAPIPFNVAGEEEGGETKVSIPVKLLTL